MIETTITQIKKSIPNNDDLVSESLNNKRDNIPESSSSHDKKELENTAAKDDPYHPLIR